MANWIECKARVTKCSIGVVAAGISGAIYENTRDTAFGMAGNCLSTIGDVGASFCVAATGFAIYEGLRAAACLTSKGPRPL